MNTEILQEIKKTNIYSQMKKLLFTGEILYGERFTETQISERFNVSRMPVREAFKLLTYEGFIEKSETTGYKIKTISEQDLIDTYAFRECLDGMLTYLFTLKHTTSQLFYLENILDAMQKNKDSGNETLMSSIDQEFHGVIARGAGNRQMLTQFELVFEKIIFSNHILIHDKLPNGSILQDVYTPQYSRSVFYEHEEIVQYIKSGNPEEAEKCARKSVKEGLKKTLEILAKQFIRR
ncbi:MAG: GntR family transcriptional regulator [Spirochaetales bacterium]